MTSAALQIIALITMTIDHIGYELFPGVELLRMIGRLTFPLFVFLLVEGFMHTRSRRKYLARLALFAILSEVPYMIFSKGPYFFVHILASPMNNLFCNVFYELMLIFLAVWSVQAAIEKNRLFFAVTALCAGLAVLMGTMYGWYGVVMGICFYLFRDKRPIAILCLAVLTALYCLEHGSLFQIYAIFAAVPIYFYNGERGRRLPKYFAYIYYPAHPLVIYAVFNLMP